MKKKESEPLPSLGIFQNQDEVAKNIEKSAEAVGVEVNKETIEKLAEEKPVEVFVAKKSCNWCFGKGTVDYAPNSKQNTRLPQSIRALQRPLDEDEEPESGWINPRPKTVKALCKCVRIRLE